MITVEVKGSVDHAVAYLRRMKTLNLGAILNKYGSLGQNALSNATPTDSGLTAASWYFTTETSPTYSSIRWHNNDIENGFPVAIMLQYGHGTGTGGYVQGRDYIMPAIRPIFDQILADVVREVSRI